MKASHRITAISIFALLLTQSARANLVQDGTFSTVTYSGALPLATPFYGQFGSDGTGVASNATLAVANWDTGGYNFVFSAATVDQGTQANGANAGQPNQAPGQFNNAAGYGTTYMWGTHNGGASTWVAPPSGGNFIASDGAYEQGPITQTITGLTPGKIYALKFYWGGAQQQGTFTQATTEQWTVSLGTGTHTTTTLNLGAESFSGWTQVTFYYIANTSTETLSFLAAGTPNGQPPFALLAGVDLEIIPDFSNWMVFAGFGAICVFFEMMRRRRRRSAFAPVA